MKKVIALVVGMLFVCTSVALAGTAMKGKVVNVTRGKNVKNVAVGVGNKANLGSIKMKNVAMKGKV
ncbi:MAG: hypothetical protein JRF59_15735, partial [Deltaproteobacteria bacterium]|nr:hypothetical protein [Deltaproteobacteria bacterium]